MDSRHRRPSLDFVACITDSLNLVDVMRGRGSPLIYLDFDGTLHPDEVHRHPRRGIYLAPRYQGHHLFEHAEALAKELRSCPAVKVVLSTNWVRVLGYSRARSFLPPELQAHVVGATYHSRMCDDAFLDLGRGLQVLGDVGRRKPSRWIALDDDDSEWPAEYLSHLLKTDPLLGLTPALDGLRAWLQAVALLESQGADAHDSSRVLAAPASPRLGSRRWLVENQGALESSNAFVNQSGLPLGSHRGLAGAISRGTRAAKAWIQIGELVSTRVLADRWAWPSEQLETATRLGEVLAISIDGEAYYPCEFLGLEPTIVKAVMNATSTLRPVEKLVFWKRRHGALGGRTVVNTLSGEGGHSHLEAVLRLARAWALEQTRS